MGSNVAQHDEQIIALNAQGMTCPQIARALGMTRDGVRFACHRLGLEINRAGQPANRYDAQIAEMRADGVSSREIAERLGVTRCFVLDRYMALGALHKRPVREDDATLIPFDQLSIHNQRTLRRLLPGWFGEEMR